MSVESKVNAITVLSMTRKECLRFVCSMTIP